MVVEPQKGASFIHVIDIIRFGISFREQTFNLLVIVSLIEVGCIVRFFEKRGGDEMSRFFETNPEDALGWICAAIDFSISD